MLTDPEINSYIENEVGSVDDLIKKIDGYFFGLKKELETAIEKAKARTKITLSNLAESYGMVIDSHKTVSEIKEFQTVILNLGNNNITSSAADDSLH